MWQAAFWPQEPEPQAREGVGGLSWQALGSWFGSGQGKGDALGANFKSCKYRVSPRVSALGTRHASPESWLWIHSSLYFFSFPVTQLES